MTSTTSASAYGVAVGLAVISGDADKDGFTVVLPGMGDVVGLTATIGGGVTGACVFRGVSVGRNRIASGVVSTRLPEGSIWTIGLLLKNFESLTILMATTV